MAAFAGTLLAVEVSGYADPLASIAVATLIAFNAVRLLRANAAVLLGRSPGPEFAGSVEAIARSVPGVVAIHELRAEYVGADVIHAGMHLEVEPSLSIQQAEQVANEVREKIHARSEAGFCVIQLEAAKSPAAHTIEGAHA